jgi:hypothetical protein
MFGPSFVYRFVRSFLRRRKLVLFQSVEEHIVCSVDMRSVS